MSPLGRGYGVAAILVAATGIADYELFGFRGQRIRAMMNSLAKATSSGRGRRGRDRHGNQISHEREEQRQCGRQAPHARWKLTNCGGRRQERRRSAAVAENPKERRAGKMPGILRLRHTRRFAERVSPLRMTDPAPPSAFRLCPGFWPTTSGRLQTESANRTRIPAACLRRHGR